MSAATVPKHPPLAPAPSQPLRLAFLLYEYFPFGGLQRDCLRTAQLCASRGHQVTVYTRSWDGDRPPELQVVCLGQKGWTNVGRNRLWWRDVSALLTAGAFDRIIGFNKLPGLDVYFGADPCYVAKMNRLRPRCYRWFPRYRYFRTMEAAVFQKGRSTRILVLTDHEIPIYQEIYQTEAHRFHVLPPGIARRSVTEATRAKARLRLRRENGWSDQDLILVLVGSGFRVKGLDRAIRALAGLSESRRRRVRLVVIGRGAASTFARMASRAGVGDRVHFMGPRTDVPDWLEASDVLVHPAYSESAGMILLEALASGLAVLTTDTCGYAPHVSKSGGGIVLASPFSQTACDRALAGLIEEDAARSEHGRRGLAYATKEDLYSCHEEAVALIESFDGPGRYPYDRKGISSVAE